MLVKSVDGKITDTTITKDDLPAVIRKALENPWISGRTGEMREDPFMLLDYELTDRSFAFIDSLEELREKFLHGNWAINVGFIYDNLAFINQVNGGDEWTAIKKFPDGLIMFESISMELILEQSGELKWRGLIDRLRKASKEQCLNYTY